MAKNFDTGYVPEVVRIAEVFEGRRGMLPSGVFAKLRRMNVDRVSMSAAELVAVLRSAGISLSWMKGDSELDVSEDRLQRLGVLVHALSVLSGVSRKPIHQNNGSVGRELANCGFSEMRMSKVLNARGKTLQSQVILLTRFMTSRGAKPCDLRPIGDLILNEGLNEERAEKARLKIARGYFSATPAAA